MRLRFAALGIGVFALTACTAILGDFDVGSSTPGGQEAGPGVDGGGPGPGQEAGQDAPVSCTAPQVACGTTCVTLGNDPENCGACGRSCGGGACTAGKCSVAEYYKSTTPIGSIDVGAADVFWATVDTSDKLLACSKAACKAAPRQVASMTYPIRAVTLIGNGTLTFISAPAQGTERLAVYACPVSGCPAVPTAIVSAGLMPIEFRLRPQGDRVYLNTYGIQWADCQPQGAGCSAPITFGAATRPTSLFTPGTKATYFVYRPSGATASSIAYCANTDTPCTPTVLVDNVTVTDDVTDMLLSGTNLIWSRAGRDGFSDGRIRTCDISGGTCTPKDVVIALDSPVELMADASGLYWITKDRSRIQRCAPNGCTGGAQDFAVKLDQAHSIVHDEKFIYWAEKASISRVVKPL